jgi:DNA-binding transcriptional ArsR family regulator
VSQTRHQFKAQFFKTLAHPARLAILEHLRNGEKSVNELQTLLDARLRGGNLVGTRKEGTTVYYSVRDPLIFQLMDVAWEIFNRQLISQQELLQQLKEEVEALE